MLQRVLAAEFGMTGRNGNGGWQSCFLWREMTSSEMIAAAHSTPQTSPSLPPPPPPTGTWWQVDLGSVQDIRAVQLVNRADCCEDRLVGARIVVSSTPNYEAFDAARPSDVVSCGSVDEAESPIGEQDVIIKACEPNTAGRYVTVVGPNRIYPDPDNLYSAKYFS